MDGFFRPIDIEIPEDELKLLAIRCLPKEEDYILLAHKAYCKGYEAAEKHLLSKAKALIQITNEPKKES